MTESTEAIGQLLGTGEWRKWIDETFQYVPAEDLPRSDLAMLFKPQVRDKAPFHIRPKLKNEAIFFETSEGVIFRSDRQSFFISGVNTYKLICKLIPILDGKYTLEEICTELNHQERNNLVALIKMLIEGGVLSDIGSISDIELSNELIQIFGKTIDLLEHLVSQPYRRFQAFRKSQILLVGHGLSFQVCAVSLLKIGLEHLFVFPTQGLREDCFEVTKTAEMLKARGCDASFTRLSVNAPSEVLSANKVIFDTVIYCGDGPTFCDLRLLNRACSERGLQLFPGFVLGSQSVFGPLIPPSPANCWLCSLVHFIYDRYEDAPTHNSLFRASLSQQECLEHNISMSRLLGRDMAFELFKILAGTSRIELHSTMMLQTEEPHQNVSARPIPHAACACMGYCQEFFPQPKNMI